MNELIQFKKQLEWTPKELSASNKNLLSLAKLPFSINYLDESVEDGQTYKVRAKVSLKDSIESVSKRLVSLMSDKLKRNYHPSASVFNSTVTIESDVAPFIDNAPKDSDPNVFSFFMFSKGEITAWLIVRGTFN